jgi:hypothetical protein
MNAIKAHLVARDLRMMARVASDNNDKVQLTPAEAKKIGNLIDGLLDDINHVTGKYYKAVKGDQS